jgi:hypothetical protein
MHAMDVDTAEALAGVVRLLGQAAVLAWSATDRAGARSPGQLFAFGVDQARDLVPHGTGIDGPVPACGEPAGLLRSAEQVWAVSWPAWTPTISISSLPCCGMPAAPGRPVVPEMTPQSVVVMTDDGRDRFRCLTRIATARSARPRQSLRERPLRHSQPDPGASLADYPGLPWAAVELIMNTIGGDGLPKMN